MSTSTAAVIPDVLKALPQWVMWKLEERDGKKTKIPYNAQYPTRKAASDNPHTWSTFNQSVFTLENESGLKLSGIGFMFAPPYIGVDFDHCRNPDTGEIDPEALEEITQLSSYTELSPSGTGVHVIVKGNLPDNGKKKGDREVYTKGRFFTVTGDHLEGTPLTINENQAAIDNLWQKWFPEPLPIAPHPVQNSSQGGDDEILSRCLKTSKGKFKALFEGDPSGYPSASEADQALFSILAMHTQDVRQIERLARQSKLYREKWDREDYVGRTIAKALQNTISTGGDEKKAPSKVDFSTIAEEIRQDMHIISVRQNLFYREDGVYMTNTGQIEAKIQAILTKMKYEKSLVSAKREVLSYLADYEPYSIPPFNQHYGYLPVKNGILHITEKSVSIQPYTEDFLFSYRLPITYDPDADQEPVRDVFIDWVDDENVKYLIQLPAQAIIQSWGDCFKTAYLFEGPKNAAKTTYLEFLGATIGSMNYSTTPLSDLLYNKYAKYDLLGKILNLADDLSEIPLKNLGEFKKLTGGMPITVERKHCDRITMALPAVHAFTCNRPPKCSITDDPAWWDRWVYVYFGNTFPINPQWKKRFIGSEKNLSGFLLLIVDAIKEIMAGKFQRMDPTLVEMMWTSASDTVSKFLLKDCTIRAEGVVSKDDFFEAYCECCTKEKQTPIPRNALTRELAKKGIVATRLNVGRNRVQSYRGVVLNKVEKNPDYPDQTALTDNLGQGSQGDFQLKTDEKNEIRNDSTCTRVYACNSENTLTTLTKPQTIRSIVVRILLDLEPFQGVDGEEYDCQQGDLITLPEENARVLIQRGYAVLVTPPAIGSPVKPFRWEEEIG